MAPRGIFGAMSNDHLRADALMTTQEVAKRLRCSTRTVLTLITDGEVTAMRVGRDYRIDADSVEAYVERQTIRPPKAG